MGVFQIVVGAIQLHEPQGLIEAIGIVQSLVLLSALIAVQVYLIAARVFYDFRGGS